MVKLRLRRGGRKARPYYWIVAADSRTPRDGRNIETIGSYDPMRDPAAVKVDHEKALKWLKDGAQPSDTVRSILSKEGLMLKLHLWRKGKSEEEIQKEFEAWKLQTDAKVGAAADAKQKAREEAEAQRMEAERKVREERAAAIAAKNTPETPEREGGAEGEEAGSEEATAEVAAEGDAPAAEEATAATEEAPAAGEENA